MGYTGEIHNPISRFVILSQKYFDIGYNYAKFIEHDSVNLKNRHGAIDRGEFSFEDRLLGSRAEIALRCYLGFAIRKFPYLKNFHGADIGGNIGVKSSGQSFFDLMIRPPIVDGKIADNPDFLYVHVCSTRGSREFEIKGFLEGCEAQKYDQSDPGGRNKPVHLIPQMFLKDITTLRPLITPRPESLKLLYATSKARCIQMIENNEVHGIVI